MSEKSFTNISQDQIPIKDIIDLLIKSWKIIVLGGVVGGLLGLGYVVTTPAKYHATVDIQVAKIANVDVEAPGVLIEKLKMPFYYSQETHMACNAMDKLNPGEIVAKTLKPSLNKSSQIINISYTDKSPENARKCLESVLDDIRASHALLAKPIFDAKTNQLRYLKLKLELAEKAEKILKIDVNKDNINHFNDSERLNFSMFFLVRLSKENDILDLRDKIQNLEMNLVEPLTKETSLIAPIYVPQQKISPKLFKIFVAGMMVGLFVGSLLIMSKYAYGGFKVFAEQNKLGSSIS